MKTSHSFWLESLEDGDDGSARQPLPGDAAVDVAIVGAGFSGLWTAYYLLRTDPSLRVMVIEAETAGFGASGRNGGWAVPETGFPFGALEDAGGAGTAAAMMREMFRAVDEIGSVTDAEGIDCGYAKGGALWLASDGAQLHRLRGRVEMYRKYGLGDDYDLLGPAETIARVNATGMHGAVYTRHAAAVQPARLARGLARAVERLGGTVHEGTPARSIDGRRVVTERGTVTAEVVVRCTEAYTATLEGLEREVAPVQNFMIATEPIPESTWQQIGLTQRELFEDSPVMLAYGQRTADGRIAWGGMGAPYRIGSRVPPSPMTSPRIATKLRDRLVQRFPMLADIEVTHHWGGVLGMARDMRSGLGFDRATGQAWTGPYGGAGVVPSNTAARTLADLITGVDSDLTRFPWVNHQSRPWEPEPLRWLGINAATTGVKLFDKLGALRGR